MAFAARAQPDADPAALAAVPEPPAVFAGPAFSNPLLVSVAAYLAMHDPRREGTDPLTLNLTGKITDQFRQLSASDPAAYEPDLAISLNNLSAPAGRGRPGRQA